MKFSTLELAKAEGERSCWRAGFWDLCAELSAPAEVCRKPECSAGSALLVLHSTIKIINDFKNKLHHTMRIHYNSLCCWITAKKWDGFGGSCVWISKVLLYRQIFLKNQLVQDLEETESYPQLVQNKQNSIYFCATSLTPAVNPDSL